MGSPTPDPGLVIISNTQIFNELRELTRAQDRTSQKVDTMSGKLDTTSTDVEKRLRDLEARRWPLPVLCALLAAISAGTTLWGVAHGR